MIAICSNIYLYKSDIILYVVDKTESSMDKQLFYLNLYIWNLNCYGILAFIILYYLSYSLHFRKSTNLICIIENSYIR